jgi:uncharacterized repeat protein (TIGR04076 family)
MARPKVVIKVLESDCKYHKVGDTFEVERFCPPLCNEAFAAVSPYVYTLQQGGKVEGPGKVMGGMCQKRCPDRGRVLMEVKLAESQ